MKKLLSVLLSLLLVGGALSAVVLAQATVSPSGLSPGGTIPTPLAGDLELRDPSQLAAESLTNGALTAGTSWILGGGGDFALAANAATYTHTSGLDTLYQTSAAAAIPFASAGINGWFSFTYTTSAVTGSPVCTIRASATDFVDVAVNLTETAGTYTQPFQAAADTMSNFVIECTSSSAATITFDTLSLKQINGGDGTFQGGIKVGNGTLALPSYSFVSAPAVGLYVVSGTLRVATGNCSSAAAPAVCGAAPAGSVVIAAAGTTVTVNTTAVTANSQIFIQEDSSLGTKLSVTCNTTLGRFYAVTARTAATSFVITTGAAPITNPACFSYFIVN